MASAVAVPPSLEPRSRSSQNLLSPDTTPRLSNTGFNHDTNGALTPKAAASSPDLSLDMNTSFKSSHARSSSYLPGLVEKLPFRTTGLNEMKKGRPRGESDLGRPTLQPKNTTAYQHPRSPVGDVPSSRSSLPVELLTSVLIPLPFLSSSLNSPLSPATRHVHPSRAQVTEEVLEESAESAMPIPDSLLSFTQVCALTAGTLLLIGMWGSFTMKTSSKRRRSSISSPREQTIMPRGSMKQAARRILLRIASVALPFLATMEIGGVRTGMILLTAVASGMVGSENTPNEHSRMASIKRALIVHKWTCLVFAFSVIYDLSFHSSGTALSSIFRGYLALAKSALLLAPPLPTLSSTPSPLNALKTTSNGSMAVSPMRDPGKPAFTFKRYPKVSALISTPEDTVLTLAAGILIGLITALLMSTTSVIQYMTTTTFAVYTLSICSGAALFIFTRPSSLRHTPQIGFGIGLAVTQLFGLCFEYSTGTAAIASLILSGFAYVAPLVNQTSLEASKKEESHPHTNHHHHHHHHHHDHSQKHCSTFTKFLLAHTEDKPLIHDILNDKESRRIVYFMTINLGFMFVQTFYALVSGSLGLMTDSIHMFFDCVGLLGGLIASIMSKWPPNSRFPYGYGKVETLSGLGNGIFLMFISIEIIWESFERFMEGAELKRLSELMIVSVAGLGVNLIGLFFIGHAHHHGHDHGHDHGHSHGHDHSHGHMNGHTHSHESKHSHDHMLQQVASHDAHGHSHGHSNENMMGIYLHILADTMGSVAVIASTILTAYTGWMGWDPIASCIIAVLIIAASYPLVVGSAQKLLLTVPYDIEYKLRETLQEISNIRGVIGYAVPRFWLDDGEAGGHGHHQNHEHDHDHGHDHDDDHGLGHSHDNGHSVSHSHKHTHTHTHNSSHDSTHNHGHSHDHAHTHRNEHSHSHSHSHDHAHAHSHDHSHDCEEPRGQRILGVIHIIASRGADIEDVRKRVDEFLKERNMDVAIHVDKEGQGRCWCGGDKGMHHRTSSIVPGLG